VYSEADAHARHMRLAEEAVLIGPAEARQSYLVIENIIAAAQRTGAQAIHPGYGFLSENEAFCRACDYAGIAFIGPPVAAIHAMGSKSEAKKLMEKTGVPLTPGYHGDNQEPVHLQQQADAIGYPILIKAAAGGGGKGMRIVEKAADFSAALASCKREATASFGSAHVLLEKYLLRPRHIEFQIFADTKGNCIHLFERDCSVQRRHQKVIEEAPAPGMTAERRAAMGKAAVDAAKAVGYVGAGTVEFIVDQAGLEAGTGMGDYYFMEMNTRLQVEHPVTEMITGLDLVEWQIRIATGEALPLQQEQVTIRGHAFEARIYAEDPDKGFLPSIGTLSHLLPPEPSRHVRVDTGVEQGDAISPWYDPMIAKLIVWDDGDGDSRSRALNRMRQALAQYQIVGVANNIDFLSRLVACRAFVDANLDTGLIEREKAFLFPAAIVEPPSEVLRVLALAELLRERECAAKIARHDQNPHSPWHLSDGWRSNGNGQRTLRFRSGEIERSVAVAYVGDGYRLTLGDQVISARGDLDSGGELRARFDGQRIQATVVSTADQRHAFLQGQAFAMTVIDPLFHAADTQAEEGGLTAPMPGKVVALIAGIGERVEKGAPLLVLEAMKMEHSIVAPATGIVRSFNFNVGDQVSEGTNLVEFEIDMP
jgi:3-methylcrotonyl-CoA carboxylase alpha subunit